MLMTQASYRDASGLTRAISQALPFETEAALIDSVLNKLDCFFDGEKVFATEVPVGAGTVDVIAGRARLDDLRDRKPADLSRKEAYVLSKMYFRQRLTATTIARRTNMNISQAEIILEKLCRKELCSRSGRGFVRTSLPFSSLMAIEGKIRDWQRALQQANRNRLFCRQSFVAIDARYSRPALRNIDLFRKNRVGLALVFRDADVHVVYRPPASRPMAPVMPILAEIALLARFSEMTKPNTAVNQDA